MPSLHLPSLHLPNASGMLEPYTLREPTHYAPPKPFTSRILYAATHVVADPKADHIEVDSIEKPARLDWEKTLSYRHHLWRYGFAVAEAMDTAQRGFGLDWAATKKLIKASVAEAKSVNGVIACGAGTDQLGADYNHLSLDDIIKAYEEQLEYIEACGGQIILMASRALAAIATGPDDYAKVYSHILSQVSEPVILHWLGDMFDPKLKGYWGAADFEAAMNSMLAVIKDNETKINGMKMSLLDDQKEITMRRKLPFGIKMYTGDDFNYDVLIKGDAQGFSHGLLGIFDAIAPAAAAAMKALEAGNEADYDRIFAPTIPLSRHIFESPTFYYKTGIVFMAYLNGHQDHFTMVGGLHHKRSLEHLVTLFKLADQAGLLSDPDRAIERMKTVLEKGVAGV